MSRFDLTFAVQASALAYAVRPGQADADARATAPLLGREEALLAALRAGEAAHDECLTAMTDERARIEALKKARDEAKQFADHLGAALDVWSAMTNEGRAGVAWFAHSAGESSSEWDENGRYLDDIVARFDRQLRAIKGAAWSAGHVIEFPRGRKKGISQDTRVPNPQQAPHLEPLREFLRPLGAFWVEATGTHFTTHVGDPNAKKPKKGEADEAGPTSAHAKLAWAAVQKLTIDGRPSPYTLPMLHQASRAK